LAEVEEVKRLIKRRKRKEEEAYVAIAKV